MASENPIPKSDPSKGLKALELNSNKAGMGGLDTERINQIILETSRGSSYYEHQQKRQMQTDRKIEELQEKMSKFTDLEIETAIKRMNEMAANLEKNRDLSRVIVHVDMDAFYAAVEIRDNPSLADKPIAVGCSSMLSTSNYIARQFGVRAAMPGFIASKLCPDLIIVPPNFPKYIQISKDVREILKNYDPHFCSMGLDEAYLDITDYVERHNINEETALTAFKVVQQLRDEIYAKTQLTSSAGIAPNMMLAKVCSDQKKPNGQFEIPPCKDDIMEFIRCLPVRKVTGIGSVTEQLLQSLGVVNCCDLWEKRGLLSLLFSPTSIQFFLNISLGLGSTVVRCEDNRKSMSVERTFSANESHDVLYKWCSDLCEELSKDLKSHSLLGKTVTLKIKTTKFEVLTRATTLVMPTSNYEVIHSTARNLLLNEINAVSPNILKLRLLGVRMSSLVDELEAASHKQQSTLAKYLTKNKDEVTNERTYSCPICNDFMCKSLHELNLHVDVCLSTTSPNTPSKKLADEDAANDQQEKSLDQLFAGPSEEKNATYTDSKKNSVFLSEKPLDNNENAGQTSIPDENAGNSFICPVCNKKQNLSMNELNNHIDTCLNRTAISSLLTEDRLASGTKRNKLQKQNKKTKKCKLQQSLDRYLV